LFERDLTDGDVWMNWDEGGWKGCEWTNEVGGRLCFQHENASPRVVLIKTRRVGDWIIKVFGERSLALAQGKRRERGEIFGGKIFGVLFHASFSMMQAAGSEREV